MKNSIQFIAVLSVLISVLCLPKISVAQNNSADTLLTFEMEELIVTASRYEETPFTVGRNVTVISYKELEKAFHFNVNDLLARQQSIHIVGNGQTPGSLTQGFLRGSNSNHFLIMINGIRISDPSTVNNAVNLSEISLLGVERIEVVRGSHSTLYGSSAIGGVINIITRKKGTPGFNIDVGTRNGVFGANTFSTSNNLMINYTSPDGWYVNTGIFQQYTNGLDATIDTVSNTAIYNPQDSDDFQKLDILGRAGYKTEEVEFYVSYRNEDQTAELDKAVFNDDNNARVNFNRSLFGYGATYDFSEQLEVAFKGAYSKLSRDFVNDSTRIDRQGNFDGTFVETNAIGSLWKNGLTATLDGRYAQIIAGVESSVQTMNIRNYVFFSSFNYESESNLDSLDLKETITAGFAQVELNAGLISESLKEFSLVLGGRVLTHNEFGTHFTYEINPKVRLSPATLLYATLSTGYNVPSLYQLYSPGISAAEEFTLGNSFLEPEQSVSYELGWKQRIGEWMNFEAALFNTHVKNIITYIYLWNDDKPIKNLTFVDYLGDTYINLSEQNIKGVEIGLTMRPFNNFSFGGNFTFMQTFVSFSPEDINKSYTGGNYVQVYNSGKFINSKKELEGLTRRPAASAFIWSSYRPVPGLQLKITSKFVGARDDIYYSANLGPFGAIDRTKVSGYNLTNISAYYKFNTHFSVGLQIENIFGTDYVEIRGYSTQGRGVFLQASYDFGSF